MLHNTDAYKIMQSGIAYATTTDVYKIMEKWDCVCYIIQMYTKSRRGETSGAKLEFLWIEVLGVEIELHWDQSIGGYFSYYFLGVESYTGDHIIFLV